MLTYRRYRALGDRTLGTAGSVISSGDVVLVTGASGGIGREIVRPVAARGAAVVLVARGEQRLREVESVAQDAGARSTYVLPADVGDQAAVTAVVEETLERYGRIDAVVNAAGVFACGPVARVPAEVFDAVVRINLLGSANVARATLPVLARQERGSLLLFGSLLGHVTAQYLAPYAVSKWGVRALARTLEAEYADTAVRIGYVAPSGVDTPIYRRAANYVGHPLRPPPPLVPPSFVARDVVDFLDGRRRVRLAKPVPRLFHRAARAGFALLPSPAYDAVAGTMVTRAGMDRERSADPDPGAVFEPVS
ncbi:SDR family NAD(P)-dependent oxidoreductase [Nocardioides antri]|uniref:SDR family NAD(P)-dependent oxidoreductase n=1 Tax=Nocardioides antri TaxID=2607659 RepID=UPI00165F2D00|nr:SDR family oxidoreductase [Nocardioides antri]